MFDLIDFLTALCIGLVVGLGVGYAQTCIVDKEEDHLAGEPPIHEVQPPFCDLVSTDAPGYDTEAWWGLCIDRAGRWHRYDEL